MKQIIVSLLVITIFIGCSKNNDDILSPTPTPTPNDPAITPGVDPQTASSIGFFLNDWQPKSFTAPTFTDVPAPTINTTNVVTVDATGIITKIPQSVFGQNAVWWMGPLATETRFTTPVTNLHPHIIRFPGGSSSDEYFWNATQGNKPADAPTNLLKDNGVAEPANYIYGKTNLNWQQNLDSYYSMLQQTNNKGIITVNYGYARYGTSANPVAAAAHLAADWVRYDNGRTQYWEVGNENFGNWERGYRIKLTDNQDGQPEIINGALYAAHFKVFADSMKKAAMEIGRTIFIGSVAFDNPALESYNIPTIKNWNIGMMANIGNAADFYVVHNYFTPFNQNSNSATILNAALTVPKTMADFIKQSLQTYGAPMKPIAMDEWNMFAVGSKQQVSNVSGLFATIVMGESIKNKYGMAARWDMFNAWENGNDHGLFSAGDEPAVAKWTPRPSFYYMYYFQKLLGDRLVNTTNAGSANIVSYASTYATGQVNVTLVNTGNTAEIVQVKTANFYAGNRFYWYTLEGSNDNGEFSRKVLVNGSTSTQDAGGPADYATLSAKSAMANTLNGIKVTVPARGAVVMVIDKK